MPYFEKSRNVNIQVSDRASFQDIRGNVNNFIHYRPAEKGITHLERFTPGGASYDSSERFPPPKCHPCTCMVVLDDIMQWISGGSDILWLHGPECAGKSAIAQTLSERCAETKQLAATFFFDREKPDRNTADLFWATIAFHIAMHFENVPGLREAIGRAVERHQGILKKSLGVQMKHLIVDPFFSIETKENTGLNVPFLVIIDGLDECISVEQQSHILLSIADIITTFHLPLRFLITSRPEPHIWNIFHSDFLRRITYSVSLDIRFRPVDDRVVFLCREFNKLYEKHKYTMKHIHGPLPSDRIAEKSFINPSTVLRFIDHVDSRPTTQLEYVLNASYPGAFSELDLLFLPILSTSTDITLLLRILGCIIVATRPLSAVEIEALLSLHPGDVHQMLGEMNPLLYIPDSESIPTQTASDAPLSSSALSSPYYYGIHMLHTSFLDFIFSPKRAAEYHLNKHQIHLDMARGCFQLARNSAADPESSIIPITARQYIIDSWQHHSNEAMLITEIVPELLSVSKLSWSILLSLSPDDPYGNLQKLHPVLFWLCEKSRRYAMLPTGLCQPLDVLQCPLNIIRYEILSSYNAPALLLFFAMFECLDTKLVNEILYAEVAHRPARLRRMQSFNYRNNLALYVYMKTESERNGNPLDTPITHTRLACTCIQILLRNPVLNSLSVSEYARTYWAKHLFLASSFGNYLREPLEQLATSFFALNLNGLDAHLVVRWLKYGQKSNDVPQRLISLWEAIAREHGEEHVETPLPVPWPEQVIDGEGRILRKF